MTAILGGSASAVLSPDGIYRYSLTREWLTHGNRNPTRVLWIMLNPSTADAEVNDPTIRRCIRFSQDWGFSSLEVVNLFALRATDPKQLGSHPDPFGPDNAAHIGQGIVRADRIVAAWGAEAYKSGRRNVLVDVGKALWGRTVHCLGVTRSGAPRHPLYVPASVKPEVFLA